MGQLYAKNGLILGTIPKISQNNNFLKKPVTGRFRLPKTKNQGTPVLVPGFDQKSENRTYLTPLIGPIKIYGKFFKILIIIST